MAKKNYIHLEGVRVNNLKNLSLKIPIGEITCFMGPSGSGKTSLAYHTLLAESKRRLMNCYPNNLRFFSQKPASIDVDRVAPVLPVFGLQQINPVKGSRTTVSDSLGVTHLIQSLFYNLSEEYCPDHDIKLFKQDLSEQFLKSEKIKDTDRIHFFIKRKSFIKILGKGILPPRTCNQDGEIRDFDLQDSYWEILRVKGKSIKKLNTSIKEEVEIFYKVNNEDLKRFHYLKSKSCSKCDYEGQEKISENYFSPFNAEGACPKCKGFGANLVISKDRLFDESLSIDKEGVLLFRMNRFSSMENEFKKVLKKKKISTSIPIKKIQKEFEKNFYEGSGGWTGFNKIEKYLNRKKYKPGIRVILKKIQVEEPCNECLTTRINKNYHNFRIDKKISITNTYKMNIEELLKSILKIKPNNESSELLLKKIKLILESSIDIGLGHLNISRKTKTLSAGEYQRIQLVKYLSFEGTGSLFVFDEPSVGLDKNQQKLLVKRLKKIKDQGNTVVLVEHSETLAQASDHLFLLGPGAGPQGGKIVYEGKFKKSKKLKNEVIKRNKSKEFFVCNKFDVFNRSYSSSKIPNNSFCLVKGETGSGKTTYLKNIFANDLNYQLHSEYLGNKLLEKSIIKSSPKNLPDGIITIDANLNRFTSRSSVGSLTDLSGNVRKYYANLELSKISGFEAGHFSSNSKLGQCNKCQGSGYELVEMPYMDDIRLVCDECDAKGIKPEYAEVNDGSQTIYEALSSPMGKILDRIPLTPKFKKIYEYFKKLNLDYLSLDRKISSLSGGEKQRIYLLSKLIKKQNNQFIILENLSFGISQAELPAIAKFLRNLVDQGNSVCLIDHHEVFSNYADYELKISPSGKIETSFLG